MHSPASLTVNPEPPFRSRLRGITDVEAQVRKVKQVVPFGREKSAAELLPKWAGFGTRSPNVYH